MWKQYNENPLGKRVGDCSVRSVSKALDIPWDTAYTRLTLQGYVMGDMPSSNAVIAALLKQNGFKRGIVPDACQDCYTLEEFAAENPHGTYVVFMDKHVATIVDGVIWDAWDSSKEYPLFYFYKEA